MGWLVGRAKHYSANFVNFAIRLTTVKSDRLALTTIRRRSICFTLLVACVLYSNLNGPAAQTSNNTDPISNCWSDRSLNIEDRKLCLEFAKFERDREKVASDFYLELFKAVITALSIAAPLG